MSTQRTPGPHILPDAEESLLHILSNARERESTPEKGKSRVREASWNAGVREQRCTLVLPECRSETQVSTVPGLRASLKQSGKTRR